MGNDLSHVGQFTLLTGEEGLRERVVVNLRLVPQACDTEAGGELDPQGVGPYRLPNDIDPVTAVPACEAAVAANPETPRFHYQLARSYLAASRVEDAYVALEKGVEVGHVRSMVTLAALLTSPRLDRELVDVPYDPDRAVELLDGAVARGDGAALYRRGRELLSEGQTEAERAQGFELLDQAAEMGLTVAMDGLGYSFMNDDNDYYDPLRAFAYLTASAERNSSFGHYGLGLLHLRDLEGIPRNVEVALSHLEEASALGHPTAPTSIARMYLRGDLSIGDVQSVMEWLDLG